jgi:uncharacterized membrane protein YkvA (DUF1232 family)
VESSQEINGRFVALMTEWLCSLPHDLKILYEAASDENLARKDRELCTGAIIYTVSPNDFISADRHDFLSFADDALLLRMALYDITSGKGESDPEDTEYFISRFPEFFESLEEELAVCQKAMGELYDWMKTKVDALRGLEYKGKKVAVYLDDDEAGEFLYEDGLAFRTEYPVDEETISDKLKKASTVIELIAKRKEEEDSMR